MPSVLPAALFSHLNATCSNPFVNSTFLSWGSRMTAGLSLSFGILPAFAWVLGLFLKGRAFCKAFGMCSELKCFFCLTISWKTNKQTDINYDLNAFKICIKSSQWIVDLSHKISNTWIWQSEIRIQSYIKHGLPQKTCITLGETEKYTEYLQFCQEFKCAYFYNMDDESLHWADKKIQSLLKWKKSGLICEALRWFF